MPSVFGILMSVMITSNIAPSSFFLAASPPIDGLNLVAVAAQGDFQHLADGALVVANEDVTHAPLLPPLPRSRSFSGRLRGVSASSARRAMQTQHKLASLSQFRACPDFTVVGLHDLVHNGQAESGAAFELRLEGLENFVHDLRIYTRAGIGEADVPVGAGHRD